MRPRLVHHVINVRARKSLLELPLFELFGRVGVHIPSFQIHSNVRFFLLLLLLVVVVVVVSRKES